MEITKSSIKDLDRIVELWKSSNDIVEFGNIDKRMISSLHDAKNSMILIAKIQKQLVGAAHLQMFPEKGICMLNNFVVQALFRNKGIGTKLIKEAEKVAKKKKCKKLVVFSFDQNMPMANFAAKNGFSEAAKLTAYAKSI